MSQTASSLKFNDYLELCKPKVVALILFTAVIGMFLATPGMVPLDALVFGTVGIGLAASSAAAINQLLDQRFDAKMARTQGRPLPQGHVNSREVLIFAGILGALSMANFGVASKPAYRRTDLLLACRLRRDLYRMA